MIILGIDPGYAKLGYSVVEVCRSKYLLKVCGAIETHSSMVFPLRLEKIYNSINLILEEFKPNAASVETIYFQNNQKTAIKVAHARGVIILALQRYGVKIFEYTPLQVKIALTGYGKATKRQIILMTQRLLRLNSPPDPDDAADAVAVAVCHANAPRISL